MPNTIAELRSKRAKIAMQARERLERARAENREFTADEQSAFDAAMNEVDSLGETIERIERQEREYQRLLAVEQDSQRSAGRRSAPPVPGLSVKSQGRLTQEERERRMATDTEYRRKSKAYGRMFRSWLKGGLGNLAPEEYRTLQAGIDIDGGYLFAPTQFVNDLLKRLDDRVFIRQLATITQLADAASLGVPTLEVDAEDADWTAELYTGGEDDTIKFGRRELMPKPLAKRVKISNRLLQLAPNAESIVNERVAYKFEITEEKAFLTGNGVNQPLGMFTPSDSGISTARDVTVAFNADGLIDAKYSLKPQYQDSPSLVWLFHRDAIKTIRKLKDSNNQYLWQPMGNGLSSDKRDTILDVPFITSEYVPNTYSAGKYFGLIGDLKYYWIAEALDHSVQRLVELYAERNQVGFIYRREVDGMPALEEAFSRLKLNS